MQTFLELLGLSLAAGIAITALLWPVLWWVGVFESPAFLGSGLVKANATKLLSEPPPVASSEQIRRIELAVRRDQEPVEFVKAEGESAFVVRWLLSTKVSRRGFYAASA